MKENVMTIKLCLDCDHEIDLGLTPTMGQRVKCTHCGVILEIISTDPTELDWVYDGPAVNVDWGKSWWRLSTPSTDR